MAKSKMIKVKEVEPSKVHALLYARVSTDRQAEEGYSIDVQKESLVSYAKSMFGGQNVETELFIDDGYSGGNLDRPGMQRLISTVESNQATHVIVYKLDRLSRSQKDTLYLIEDVFLKHNVAFVSIRESFNTDSAFGRAVVGILSVFAQLERENIFERTRSGMQKRVESGLWMGGGGTPFGYDYDPQQGILVPNKDADTVKAIYDLYIEGYSMQSIANRLHLKYDKLVAQILKRKSNAGFIVYNGVEYKGLHEPIISMETYEKAMSIMESRSGKYHSSTSTHLLTGLVVCGYCGAKMRYIKWGKQGYKLMCYSKTKGKPYLIKDPDCPSTTYSAKEVEDAVIGEAFRIIKTDTAKTDGVLAVNVGQILQNNYAQLELKLKRLYSLYADDGNDVLLSTISDVKSEMEKLKAKISEEESRNKTTKAIQQAKSRIADIENIWDALTDQEKRNALQSIINRITITDGQLDIDFKL